MNQSKPRRRYYDAEFKKHAMQLLLSSGRSLHSVARGLGLSDTTLKTWKADYLSQPDNRGLLNQQLEIENQRLRRELERVSTQRDILKKSLGILSEDPPQKDMPK